MRRDKLDILRDILAICSRGRVRKTEIVYGSNMNFAKISRYIDWLIAHDLLKQEGPFYLITPRGLSLLSDLNEMISK